MPALSSTMTEGKVVQWLKGEGDKVSKGEALVVVESDKADMDVESFEDGYLGAIVVDEGGTANVGSPIAYIAESEGEIADAQAKGGASANGAAAAPAEAEAPKVSYVCFVLALIAVARRLHCFVSESGSHMPAPRWCDTCHVRRSRGTGTSSRLARHCCVVSSRRGGSSAAISQRCTDSH